MSQSWLNSIRSRQFTRSTRVIATLIRQTPENRLPYPEKIRVLPHLGILIFELKNSGKST